MWKLKVLSGLHRGQIFQLNSGTNTLGRSQDQDICLTDKGISKHHAHIVVTGNEVKIIDQNSSNGSFIDDAQIKEQTVFSHNRLVFYNVLCQVLYDKKQDKTLVTDFDSSAQALNQTHHQENNNTAANLEPVNLEGATPAPSTETQNIWQKAQHYAHTNILPALYALTRIMDLKWVLALLIAVFVVLTTLVSSVPLLRTLNHSAKTRAQVQAQSIAKQLAAQNQQAIIRSMHSGLQINTATRAPGVKAAYIISSDGRVLAPAHMANQHLNIDYIHTGRKLNKASVSKIKKGFLVAMYPIEKLNPQLQVNQTAAFSVVQYDAKSLEFNTAYTASLLIQNFFIVLLLGGGLFLLIYFLIKHPIEKINEQISTSLQKNANMIDFEYKFQALGELITHIKSLLTRAVSAEQHTGEHIEADRVSELTNLISMQDGGSLAILEPQTLAVANDMFYSITGLQLTDVENIKLDDLSDQALRLNLKDLIESAKTNPSQLATGVLEFNGQEYTLLAQAVFGTKDVAYYIVNLKPQQGEIV